MNPSVSGPARPASQNPSDPHEVSKAPGVTGKFSDRVTPVTNAFPPESTAIPNARSSLAFPPRKVEYTRPVPDGFIFVTNASEQCSGPIPKKHPPLYVVSNAPAVVGNLDESVSPTMYAFPAESIAMASGVPWPMNVE